MTSRERVVAALNHEETDRVPIDLGGNQTGITCVAYENLLSHLGWREDIEIMDMVQQLAQPSEAVLDLFCVDTRYVRAGPPDVWQMEIVEEEIRGQPHLSMTDEFGITWSMPKDQGLYHDITRSPLRGASITDIERYPWPDGADPGRFRGLRERAKLLHENTSKALVSGITGVVFEFCWYLMGLEEFYLTLTDSPAMIEAVMDHTLQYWLDFESAFLDEVGDCLRVICVGDDLAAQDGLLFSPDTYRRIVKPRQAKLYELVHSKTKAKLWYHSCGAIRELIPDFIEIGVEVLNPVQVSAKGMDTAELKREFGKDLVFWGGGCDTQHVLPHGTPNEVKAEVNRRLSDLAPGGGYVFNSVHNIQPDVAPANVMAMFAAAREFRES